MISLGTLTTDISSAARAPFPFLTNGKKGGEQIILQLKLCVVHFNIVGLLSQSIKEEHLSYNF